MLITSQMMTMTVRSRFAVETYGCLTDSAFDDFPCITCTRRAASFGQGVSLSI
jgi:hypothetical protein